MPVLPADSSRVTYERCGLTLERAVDMGEALRFSADARLIAGLDRQLRRIKCQGHDLLLDGKVTPTDIDDLPLITAVHESLFTWDGNVVWEAAAHSLRNNK